MIGAVEDFNVGLSQFVNPDKGRSSLDNMFPAADSISIKFVSRSGAHAAGPIEFLQPLYYQKYSSESFAAHAAYIPAVL